MVQQSAKRDEKEIVGNKTESGDQAEVKKGEPNGEEVKEDSDCKGNWFERLISGIFNEGFIFY